MAIIDILAKRILNKATVTQKKQLAMNAFQITLHSENFNHTSYTPGKFLRIFCGMDKNVGMTDKIRSYSVWNYDTEQHTLDLAICTHSDGPGSTWTKEIEVGDEIYFNWHNSNLIIDSSADYYILIGDISALGHLYELNRNLAQSKPRYSVIYAHNEAEFFKDICDQSPFNFYTVTENPASFIMEKLQVVLANESGKGIAYIAGDSRVCVALNSYLRKELNWPTTQVKTKPFWNPEKKGLE